MAAASNRSKRERSPILGIAESKVSGKRLASDR